MRGDEVYIVGWKITIVNVISRIRNKMSLQKLKFSGFKKKRKFSEFSRIKTYAVPFL